MKNVMIMIFTAGILLSLIPDSLAQMGPGGRMRHGMGMGPGRGYGPMMHSSSGPMMKGKCYGNQEFMRQKLNLTEDQIKRISDINGKYMGKLLRFRDKLIPGKKRLKRMLLKEKLNFNKIRAVLKEISDIEIEIRLLKIRQRLEIEKVFTPSQRRNLKRGRLLDRTEND